MSSLTVPGVAAAIRSCRFSYADEDRLQQGIYEALASLGYPVVREVRLGPHARIDLVVGDAETGRVGVEVKVAGTWQTLLRQVRRYLRSEMIDGLVVVTSRVRHNRVPTEVEGKPVAVVTLAAQGL